ncbi:hypothetical protein [Massilia sp. 9096]|uniref:hypothetical protein n=1 Tax=Massilia sp. 9096 TaxID=1500894 RepID=UPI000566421B|nr:hypothetical protein [Massilia sp. 9096]
MKCASPLRSLLGAALVLAISAALAWLTPAYFSGEMRQRLSGVLVGAIVVVYANAIPKVVFARTRCAPALAARRFTGWALVLGGLGYILASLLAPIAASGMIAGLSLGAAVTVAGTRLYWMAHHRVGG